MSLAMTEEERESFLAGLHVAVISVVGERGGTPLAVPIWYQYSPGGEVGIVTARSSRKGKLIERAGSFTLCVQSETPPYKYVSVQGPVTGIEECDVERDLRPLAHRYLGRELGDHYVAETGEERSRVANVLIKMRPARWLSVDYSKRYG